MQCNAMFDLYFLIYESQNFIYGLDLFTLYSFRFFFYYYIPFHFSWFFLCSLSGFVFFFRLLLLLFTSKNVIIRVFYSIWAFLIVCNNFAELLLWILFRYLRRECVFFFFRFVLFSLVLITSIVKNWFIKMQLNKERLWSIFHMLEPRYFSSLTKWNKMLLLLLLF